MKMSVTFAETNQSFDPAFGEVYKVGGGTVEDLDIVLDAQDSLIDALKGILATKASGGKAAVIDPLEVTANGEYTAPDGVDGYSPVVVSVPVPEGYIQPEGTLEVTENGTHDVTAYAAVEVNVPGMADEFITKAIGGDYVNDRAAFIGDYAFYGQNKLTSVDFPFVATIGIQSFAECTTLQDATIPLATKIGSNAFLNCKVLKKAHYPLASDVGLYAFRNCYQLNEVHLPLITSVSDCTFDMPQGYNDVLTQADLPKVTSIKAYAFRRCRVLKALILRADSVVALANTNAFTLTPIESGTGYVYVPRTLVDSYKVATNWSTYAAQFRALEDYTVDGTVNGALDPVKVGE